MHGIVMCELRTFVTSKVGDRRWAQILETTGLTERTFLPIGSFPDEEALALVSASCKLLGVEPSVLLRELGAHLVPTLVDTYGRLLDPAWKTLEVVLHTEHVIHGVIRRLDPAAGPPSLLAVRNSPNEVVVHYRSSRRMCHLALGIIDGLAALFSEAIGTSQRRCMLSGDAECQIVVTLLPPSGAQRRSSVGRE